MIYKPTKTHQLITVTTTTLVCFWVVSIVDRAAVFNSLPFLFVLGGALLIAKNGLDDDFKSILYPILLLSTYQVIVNIINYVELSVHLDQIKTNIRSLILIPFFLYLSKKNILKQRYVKYSSIIILIYIMIEGYIQMLTGQTILFNSTLRPGGQITSVFSNPNPFGLSMFLLCSSALLIIDRYTFLSLFLFVTSFNILILSESRAALLSFAVFSSLYLLTKDYKKVIIVISSILFFVIFENTLLESLKSIFLAEDSGRFDIWNKILPYISNQPIFGYGYDFFNRSEILPEFVAPHNSILDIFLSYGVIGIIFYLYFLYKISMEIIKENQVPYLFLVYSLLFLTLFDYSITTSKLYLAVLSILIYLSLSNKHNE